MSLNTSGKNSKFPDVQGVDIRESATEMREGKREINEKWAGTETKDDVTVLTFWSIPGTFEETVNEVETNWKESVKKPVLAELSP